MLQISAKVTDGPVSTGETPKPSHFCFPSAHVPVYLRSEDMQGLVTDREDSCALFFVSKGFLCFTVGVAFSEDNPCPDATS